MTRLFIRIIVSISFASLAILKILSPNWATLVLSNTPLEILAKPTSFLVPWLELICALALFTSYRQSAQIILMSLLSVFTPWLFYMAHTGAQDCGCAGPLVKLSPSVAILKNLALASMLAYLMKNNSCSRHK